MFDPVDPRQSFPDLERGILSYWHEEDTFRRSVELREGSEKFSFYDGPPFATGLPHYGHLLAGTIKDVIPRYQTMRGKQVHRRFGWDCHGLPVENLIEKEHGIKSKQDIEAMGVKRFNELCRGSVMRYAKEWKQTVERSGRWVDMDNDYKTMDAPYMESIWWVFKSLFDKKLIYEGHKPMHVCPHCVTPLSNFEVTQGYKDVTDLSATVKFELYEDSRYKIQDTDKKEVTGKKSETSGKTYLLAWTTTPWTLPGNLFVAVGAEIEYVKVAYNNDTYIVAKERAETVFKDKEFTIVGASFKGKTLKGLSYEPLFPYFFDQYKDVAFTVVTGDFVSTEDGTGLVHIAPGFGEDDYEVWQKMDAHRTMPLLQHVTLEGKFVSAVTDFAGTDVKPIDDPSKTDRKVSEYLEKNGKLFSKDSYRHSYPHCWRCDSPLLNYATSSWFVHVEKIKKDMLEANQQTEWVPAHLRDGRFGNWLENARDWAISRNRYWGTPLPIWRSAEKDKGQATRPSTTLRTSNPQPATSIDVIGSRDDLMSHNLIRFTKLSAVRHGEAEHNVGHFYQSVIPGVSLTEEGRKQAEKVGEYLASQKVDVIYSSPLNRALQTANAIAEATGARVIVDNRLREAETGKYERTGFDFSNLDLMKLRRQKKLQEGSPNGLYHVEGMEHWTDVHKRIEEFLRDTLPRHRSEHVVVVSHGDPLSAIEHFFTGEDPFKLSHHPMATYATPIDYFWDHDTESQMDLHKENIDNVTWPCLEARDTAEIVCVRHGETDWNKEKKIQGGDVDMPLNDTGKKQAMETAQQLKKQKNAFDAIICSDLKRASETARIIGAELGIKIEKEYKELRERNAGTWSGQTIDAVKASTPPNDDAINLAFHYATPPGGESFSVFMRRMQNIYEELVRAYAGKRVLLVAHRAVIQGLQAIGENLSYNEAGIAGLENGETMSLTLRPLMKRIPDVLDCWFESGSMPYAQQNFPFQFQHQDSNERREARGEKLPPNFPAEFIAEGIDQTRGWFYTLNVIGSALFKHSPFKHCVVNGIVLAEDGRKMSKRLKNYPEPGELMGKHGADAMRFALMNSPVVRGEDMRFSESVVEETVRSVLLPLWNSYSFFVTYGNLAKFNPVTKPKPSSHPLDKWIKAEVQDLANRMTTQLDNYDLSGTCEELFETIDALTNWYIRLSRRRFAGKGMTDVPEAEPENFEQDRFDALTTLYDVLVTLSQLLAPFCPFVTEAMYVNLVNEPHGSVHLTDWPSVRKLNKEEANLIATNRLLRRVVSLGLKVRSEQKVKVRIPLSSMTIAFPKSAKGSHTLSSSDLALLRQELNVKDVRIAEDPSELGEAYAMVDSRKVGPRLGKKVQEIIQAGKRGEFEEEADGTVLILEETLAPDEVSILYRGKEGRNIAAEKGVVVSLDTIVTKELELEGNARDLIREIQKLRKENGYDLGEPVHIGIRNADELLSIHKKLIEQEASAKIVSNEGMAHEVTIGDVTVTIHLSPKK